MSAIPNVPEAVHDDGISRIDSAHAHVQQSAYLTDTKVTNGDHTTQSAWVLHDQPVENQRPIRVIVIGAGYSGIYMGIRIPEKLRNCDLVIYEKNAALGGTWYENNYPGVACDIPSHSYQFSFNPKHDWTSLYAPGAEILEYLKETAKKYGADRFMKLKHEVTETAWNQNQGKWHVCVKGADGTEFEDTCDVLISARGLLNVPQWPKIEGLQTFEGEIMHSATWNVKYEFENKRIGIIGAGSSGIQILPKLQKLPGTRISTFVRSKTWISPPFAQKAQDDLGLTSELIPQDLIDKLGNDDEAWLTFRQKIEAETNSIHALTLKGDPMQLGAQALFEQGMQARLAKKPHYFDWIKPDFAPGCKRLTPGPGYLEALVEDNVEFVKDRISSIDSSAVLTEDGKRHELDVLICATGFYASAAPPFPTKGQNGVLLTDHWKQRATNYLTLATDNFPNHFFMLGPNGGIGEGSLTMMIESTGDYIVKAVRKIQKENIKSMVIKPQRVRDFLEVVDAYFRGTVFMDDCKSWYKKTGEGDIGEKITGVWPGSTLHCIETMRSPRWEDWEYENHPEPNGAQINQLGWMGNGWGMTQLRNPTRLQDLSFYIIPHFQDRPLKGQPEEREEFKVRPWSY